MHRLLVCFGNAEQGRLGLGSLNTSQLVPRVCAALSRFDVDSVACGGAHTAVVTSGGFVFTFGSNTYGQLGHCPEKSFIQVPSRLALPEPVQAMSAGRAHSLCITESGRLFAFGSNSHGQLGVGDTSERLSTPSLLHSVTDKTFVSVAAGANHSVALTSEGEVFTWGCADQGQLGHGSDVGSARTPRLVKFPEDIRMTAVAAGPATSACLDERGHVYAWGGGSAYQLGLGVQGNSLSPQKVPGLRGVAKLSLGGAHVVARRRDERVVLWGTDVVGALGQGRAGVVLPRPALFKYWMTDVAAGWLHSAGVSSDGRLYTWGWGGSSGSLGPLALPSATATRQGNETLPQGDDAGNARSLGAAGAADSHASCNGSAGASGSAYAVACAGQEGERHRDQGVGSAGDSDSGGGGRMNVAHDAPPTASVLMACGAGQLGVGAGTDVVSPTLVVKLQVDDQRVLRQDGGNPLNFQEQGGLWWAYRQVACGANHTAAIVEVSPGLSADVRATARNLHALEAS